MFLLKSLSLKLGDKSSWHPRSALSNKLSSSRAVSLSFCTSLSQSCCITFSSARSAYESLKFCSTSFAYAGSQIDSPGRRGRRPSCGPGISKSAPAEPIIANISPGLIQERFFFVAISTICRFWPSSTPFRAARNSPGFRQSYTSLTKSVNLCSYVLGSAGLPVGKNPSGSSPQSLMADLIPALILFIQISSCANSTISAPSSPAAVALASAVPKLFISVQLHNILSMFSISILNNCLIIPTMSSS